MKCTECGQTIGADLHPRVRQAAQVATQSIIRRVRSESAATLFFSADDLGVVGEEIEEIIVTTLELAGLTEPKAP